MYKSYTEYGIEDRYFEGIKSRLYYNEDIDDKASSIFDNNGYFNKDCYFGKIDLSKLNKEETNTIYLITSSYKYALEQKDKDILLEKFWNFLGDNGVLTDSINFMGDDGRTFIIEIPIHTENFVKLFLYDLEYDGEYMFFGKFRKTKFQGLQKNFLDIFLDIEEKEDVDTQIALGEPYLKDDKKVPNLVKKINTKIKKELSYPCSIFSFNQGKVLKKVFFNKISKST